MQASGVFQSLPLRKGGDTQVQFTRPSLFSGSDAIFGDDGTVAHLRVPMMLYRLESIVFLAGAVWCFLFLVSTTHSVSSNVTYGVTLLALASFIASVSANKTVDAYATYKASIKERGINFLTVSNKDGPTEPGKESAVRTKADFELNIDLIRYATTKVVGPLVALILYAMLPLDEGGFLNSKGIAIMTFVIGMLALTASKLLSFDYQFRLDLTTHILNIVLVLGGATCLVIVLVDILTSADTSPLDGTIWYYSLITAIGYPTMFIAVQLVRFLESSGPSRDVRLDTVKHIVLVVIDILSLGLLVFGSILAAYGHPIGGSRYFLTSAEITSSPPPPPPPPQAPAA